MRFVRVSFHSVDVLARISHAICGLVLPHLSPLPEREGADIVFVFPCPLLLVPCACNYSLRLCGYKYFSFCGSIVAIQAEFQHKRVFRRARADNAPSFPRRFQRPLPVSVDRQNPCE